MKGLIIGIDPDSNKHGVAVYRKGVLCELLNLNTIELYKWITTFEKTALRNGEIEIHLENPRGNSSSAFSHYGRDSLAVKFKKSESVGMVKMAQQAIEQLADELKIPVVLHKNSSCWKKGSDVELFKRATGWTKRSNEETRSAAYMGWLGCKSRLKV